MMHRYSLLYVSVLSHVRRTDCASDLVLAQFMYWLRGREKAAQVATFRLNSTWHFTYIRALANSGTGNLTGVSEKQFGRSGAW